MTQFMQEVKPQPVLSIDNCVDRAKIVNGLSGTDHSMFYFFKGAPEPDFPKNMGRFCPFGKVGDVIYCKETWARYQTVNHRRRTDGAAFSEVSDGAFAYKEEGFDSVTALKIHIRLTSDLDLEAVEVEHNRFQSPATMPQKPPDYSCGSPIYRL